MVVFVLFACLFVFEQNREGQNSYQCWKINRDRRKSSRKVWLVMAKLEKKTIES